VLVSGAGKQSQSSLAPPAQRTIATTAAAILMMLSALPGEVAAETIESALARAYQGNPQLNAQRAIVRQNDEGVAQALSGYRPTLSATASVGEQYTNQTGLFPAVPPALPNSLAYTVKGVTTPRSVGVNAGQTLFNGQQTVNQVRKAESQVSAARETLRVMEESVLLSGHPPEQGKRGAAAAQRRTGPRPNAGQCHSSLGPIAGGESTGRSRHPPERRSGARARRRSQ
jgi:outer membrane protein TolC